ncbi:probable cysteine desulfurase [Octopus bimaculoides]|uniref:probable cysteine desulfurase n=1 Tax=Octopus bimaculoides TaxID=37653 RepID=UPI00071C46D9|nr:probable cysteine desulfurase [Octopus bimaculoides]|eukprot:XP_014788892.1 PREDICTED: probable cysteine desulfurase [Octopus bimaculoides]
MERKIKKKKQAVGLAYFMRQLQNRKSQGHAKLPPVTMDGDENPVLKTLRENVIGSDLIVNGPYGPVKVIYCDFTASGRSMKFIEDYINEYVRPFYGNTHTTTSIVSRQTTKFRDEARQIIKNCVNATDDDVVIFCGAGCTGAIHKLIGGLDIQEHEKEKTVVLIGPYEHHSNILPWQELGIEIRRIREDLRGCIDKDNLEELLKSFSERNYQIITAFSAASNVTGIITDTVAIARMVHKYKAYSFWDFASAGPYLKIDMNPAPDATKDAVFLSPHKFLGGPGTPGKRHLTVILLRYNHNTHTPPTPLQLLQYNRFTPSPLLCTYRSIY